MVAVNTDREKLADFLSPHNTLIFFHKRPKLFMNLMFNCLVCGSFGMWAVVAHHSVLRWLLLNLCQSSQQTDLPKVRRNSGSHKPSQKICKQMYQLPYIGGSPSLFLYFYNGMYKLIVQSAPSITIGWTTFAMDGVWMHDRWMQTDG